MMPPLPRTFFTAHAPEVAPRLLGCYVVKAEGSVLLVGRIVEVEAYLGPEDAASHAHRGPTPRNQAMFGRAGHAYVYLIYGMYHCLNVVTGPDDVGEAVLIRALEPVEGIEIMQERRHQHNLRPLTNGPGKLCQAFAIDKRFYGHDLTLGQELWLAAGPEPEEPIRTCPRIGVRGDDQARDVPWRFFLKENPFVSPSPWNRK